jgi:DNA-directed RNA polymerase specialized sigma24 family protein
MTTDPEPSANATPDEWAAALYKAIIRRIARWLYNAGASAAEIEDLVSDSFEVVWPKHEALGWKHSINLGVQIVKQNWLDVLKGRTRHPEISIDTGDGEDTNGGAGNWGISAMTDFVDDNCSLDRAMKMAGLSKDEQLVITWIRNGYEAEDIAPYLKKQISVIHQIKHRALEKLKKWKG